MDACPILAQNEGEDGEWLLSNPEDCLELLLQLKSLEDSIIWFFRT